MTKSDVTIEIRLLKIILWSYIVLRLLIAGLNYGYTGRVAPEIADGINISWHIYENWINTVFIIVGSILTLRIVTADWHSLRKKNLIGLVITALVVHIFEPPLLHNKELYFFAMPLP